MLSTSENDAQLAAFLSCGKELADVFSVYLGKAEEHELARDLQILIARFDGKEIGTLRAYLRNRSDYLSRRMLAYTKEHIREFD